MKDWFASLQDRERYTVIAGAVFIVIVLLYLAIWRPVSNSINNARAQIVTQEAQIKWMQKHLPELKNLRKFKPQLTKKSEKELLGIVEESISSVKEKNFQAKIQQSKSSEVNVNFPKVQFNVLVVWIDNLWKTQGVYPKKVSVKSTDDPGIVTANVVVAR